jgi:hypothetical protein
MNRYDSLVGLRWIDPGSEHRPAKIPRCVGGSIHGEPEKCLKTPVLAGVTSFCGNHFKSPANIGEKCIFCSNAPAEKSS